MSLFLHADFPEAVCLLMISTGLKMEMAACCWPVIPVITLTRAELIASGIGLPVTHEPAG